MKAPEMIKVRMNFPKECLLDLHSSLKKELFKKNFLSKIKPKEKVGISAGSRHIKSISTVLETLIDEIKKVGGEPYILAAMGSHGGGSISGQLKVLDSLGINKDNFNVPVVGGVDTTILGYLDNGVPVNCLNHFLKMDKIIVLNRIKPHTSFRGEIESGLLKMLTIGLGGPVGAKYVHQNCKGNMSQMIQKVGLHIIRSLPIIMGVAIIENAYKETYRIEVISPESILEREKSLLEIARNIMPKLPFETIDLLICDEMGKCYSGTGMDTNIIGRLRTHNGNFNNNPYIKRILVLDLAEASQGNANGVGLADFVTRKLVDKIDFYSTYLNCLTTGFLQRAMIPIIMNTDKEAIYTALESIIGNNETNPRIVRIKNTLDLENIWVSRGFINEIEELKLEIDGSWQSFTFTNNGTLL
ncbi:MAG: hypothetical protein APF76_03835 [Desulfitibacter sp. BRH_c19]|nr:MAG: hypothetical protein APF76_03835 [Desulfitibacter sp. BRH_c19]